jgi:RhtB (resistance to homoserine/threonine) family protein
MVDDWLTVWLLGWMLVVIPGPNFALTLHNSLLHSRQAGLSTVGGIALGGIFHVTYSLIGVGVIVSQSILLFNTLKWVGAAYLVYLGLKALRAQSRPVQGMAETGPLQRGEAVRMGFLTCVLNPKSALFFFALFTQVIQPETSLALRAGYGLTIVVIQLAWYSTVALVISHPRVRLRFEAMTTWIERATGAALIGFGIRLALAHRQS